MLVTKNKIKFNPREPGFLGQLTRHFGKRSLKPPNFYPSLKTGFHMKACIFS